MFGALHPHQMVSRKVLDGRARERQSKGRLRQASEIPRSERLDAAGREFRGGDEPRGLSQNTTSET